jgi:hypothetical protein
MNKREKCKVCGFRIRGPNHDTGVHHKIKHPKIREQEKANARQY